MAGITSPHLGDLRTMRLRLESGGLEGKMASLFDGRSAMWQVRSVTVMEESSTKTWCALSLVLLYVYFLASSCVPCALYCAHSHGPPRRARYFPAGNWLTLTDGCELFAEAAHSFDVRHSPPRPRRVFLNRRLCAHHALSTQPPIMRGLVIL